MDQHQPWPPGFQRPSNPYETSGRSGTGDLALQTEHRLTELETGHRHQQVEIDTSLTSIHQIRGDLRALEDAGRQAVLEVPATIESRVRPLERRLRKLETRWWEPMRPHLWKLYMGVGWIVLAKLWQAVTGKAVDITVILDWLFRHG